MAQLAQAMSYCCVRGCRFVRHKQPWQWQPSFHTFPPDEKICAKWVKFCDNPYINGKSVKELNKKRVICGLHFSPSDKVTYSSKTRLTSKMVVPVLNPPPPNVKIIKPLTKVAVAGPNSQHKQNNVVVVSLEELESNNMGTEELTIEEDNQPQIQQQMEKNIPEKTHTFVNITQSVNQTSHTSDKKTRKVCEIPRLFFTKTPAVKQRAIQDVIDETNNTAPEEIITVETSAAASDSEDIPDDEIDCGLKELQSKLLLQTTRAAATESTIKKKRGKNIKNDPALVYDELKRQRAMNRKLRITCTRLKNRCIVERAARKNYLRHVKKYTTKEQYEAFIDQLKKDIRPTYEPKKQKRVPAQPIQKPPSEPPAMQQLSVSSPVAANPGVIQVPDTQGQGQLVRLVVFSGAQQSFAFNFDALKKTS